MKKRRIFLLLLVAALIFCVSVPSALAYFTTQTKAKGGYTVPDRYITEVEESFHDWTKDISIVNAEGSGPVFIRARAYAGSGYGIAYRSDGNWYDGGDGWWYYRPILYAQTRDENGALVGGTASGLSVTVSNIPDEPRVGENFNVVVVYESTPVQYDENGQPFADWTMTLDTGETIGG